MIRRRLLVVDDSVTIRALIDQIFRSETNVDIVGSVATGEEASAAVRRFRPDVVTLDIILPGMDGFAVLDQIMKVRPLAVVVVSSTGVQGSEACEKAMARGASSCFDKARIVSEAPLLRRAVLTAKPGRIAAP